MIKLINVNKYYQSGNDKVHVIRNLNYEFPDTGLIFILGPSGSGKSTLLNLLGGLDKPDSGEIWIENREISSFNKKEHNYYLNSYLGFVFQEYNILKDLNLKENISLSLEIQGIKTKIAKRKINKIIEEVELTGLEKRKVSQLSGGQKQRIAIARALVKEPNLIIADEPTGNLDSETSNKIFELFKKLSKNRLIIIVTHDEESANLYGDDILKIDTASIDQQDDNKNNNLNEETTNSIDLQFKHKLILEKTKIPLKTIFKLSFKNIWQKKLRYLLMFIITIISLTFLAFSIELNGDKLYQNVYTTINNNVNYADIYQLSPNSSINTEKDFYSKYKKGELMDNAYGVIKNFASDLTLHKYQTVSINYAKYGLEKANFLYNGILNTIIYYDETNTYNLLAGKLPHPDKPEILITDFILDALKHFGIVDSNSTIYSILNQYIDLGYSTNFKIVGVIETNYKKWMHLSRYKPNYVIDEYDKSMQGFKYDYLIMNSIIVGDTYYYYILNDSFQNNKIKINSYELEESTVVSYQNQEITIGNAPVNPDEIVIPRVYGGKVFNINNFEYYSDRWILQNIINTTPATYVDVSTKFNEIQTDTGNFDITSIGQFKVVGFTSSRDFLLSSIGYDNYNNVIQEAKSNHDQEKIVVELSNNPATALKQFNQLYNNDYHFIIDVFHYQSYIESYNVDPMINFVSKGGLIFFTILAIGIMWTIISIEIVDSRKEIGIMRSIGLSGSKVSLLFIIQSLCINLLAYFVSIPIAMQFIELYGRNITDPLGEISLSLYTLTYRSPIILLLFTIIVTFISTFIPLIKIMSKKIINIINERDN